METPPRTNIYPHPPHTHTHTHTLLKSVFIETKQVFRSKLVTEWIYSYMELDFLLLVLLQDLSFLTSVPAVCISLCMLDEEYQDKMTGSNLVSLLSSAVKCHPPSDRLPRLIGKSDFDIDKLVTGSCEVFRLIWHLVCTQVALLLALSVTDPQISLFAFYGRS